MARTANNFTVTVEGKLLGIMAEMSVPASAVHMPSLYRQAVGRANRGRLVHAARARKLRRRGENVRFSHLGPTGRAIYRWWPRVLLSSSKKWGL